MRKKQETTHSSDENAESNKWKTCAIALKRALLNITIHAKNPEDIKQATEAIDMFKELMEEDTK